MRIVDNEDNIEIFGDIDIGGCFKLSGLFYMRIADVRDYRSQHHLYNAVCLKDGELVDIDTDENVEYVELEAKVVG